MKSKKFIRVVAISSALASLASFAPAFAEDGGSMNTGTVPVQNRSVMKEVRKEVGPVGRPEVVGKVTSISGTTLMVSGKVKKDMASTTYTVNASSAVIIKGGATSTVSNIAVGDFVIVQGTISGTNVTAKLIRDAMLRNPKAAPKPGDKKPGMVGNGQPVIGGIVSSISGNSVVITNGGASSTSYTVDVSTAKIMVKGKQTATAADIMVGDRLLVQGTINGTSIVAANVSDQGSVKAPTGEKKEDSQDKKGEDKGEKKEGFFSRAGGFFKHLFGF